MRQGGKRIAMFLDGTWNTVSDNTNVWRLRALCAPVGRDGVKQALYYDEGVGTRRGERLRGGMFGIGLDRNVIAAYRWLIETYDPGDDLFVFGFSRGAYTVRSMTGLIAKCGLLQPGAPLSIEEVFERYQKGSKIRALYQLRFDQRRKRQQAKRADASPLKSVVPFSQEEEWLLAYSQRIPIEFVGVFDTVGALGVPFGGMLGLAKPFHHTRPSNIYKHAYQALAVDEHRRHFQPSVWTKFVPEQPQPERVESKMQSVIEQRWFVGAHANVGGGYLRNRLAQVPLAWLMSKAEALGLSFRYAVKVEADAHLDPVIDSYSEFAYGLYKLATLGTRHQRVIQLPARRVDALSGLGMVSTVNETIDPTVFDRWRKDAAYRPPGLLDWSRRSGVNLNAVDA